MGQVCGQPGREHDVRHLDYHSAFVHLHKTLVNTYPFTEHKRIDWAQRLEEYEPKFKELKSQASGLDMVCARTRGSPSPCTCSCRKPPQCGMGSHRWECCCMLLHALAWDFVLKYYDYWVEDEDHA